MKLSNKTYDRLKVVAFIVAPALTFIAALCIIWKVPYSEQITATLAALDTALGEYLRRLGIEYNAKLMIDHEVDAMGRGDDDE